MVVVGGGGSASELYVPVDNNIRTGARLPRVVRNYRLPTARPVERGFI